mmetsp:Transcript_71261/g.230786  ORF Transcript_71261/g.230786 Transcript_71261/m.230786 type:complete len:92 (+) Transcript_71261:1762-2037(+)
MRPRHGPRQPVPLPRRAAGVEGSAVVQCRQRSWLTGRWACAAAAVGQACAACSRLARHGEAIGHMNQLRLAGEAAPSADAPVVGKVCEGEA